jgi:hypothetical protein
MGVKTHYKAGDRVSFIAHDGQTHHGTVESQRGTMLTVKWDVVSYRPNDEPHEIDYRDLIHPEVS